MPVTVTLKNIPDELYESLKTSAERHRRSINGEAIVCLETVLRPSRISTDERLARVRHLRSAGPKVRKAGEIDQFKREGRA